MPNLKAKSSPSPRLARVFFNVLNFYRLIRKINNLNLETY